MEKVLLIAWLALYACMLQAQTVNLFDESSIGIGDSIAQVKFFQAEDGIRDWSVTGVQTCALPISNNRHHLIPDPETAPIVKQVFRSEERRVGKECRSRWSPYH